jgi:antitoxin component YwqK of YwqJK toxin-antitoxin module
MRFLIVFLMLSGGIIFNNAIAQDDASVKREVVFEKVNAASQMTYIYENEQLIEKGMLKNGKRDGVWQSFNSNGNLTVEATFVNGEKNGIWVVYEGLDVKYILHYQNNSRVKAIDLARAE